jgi:hypothetical protein
VAPIDVAPQDAAGPVSGAPADVRARLERAADAT